MAELIPAATLNSKGMMSIKDKCYMPHEMDKSGARIYLLATVERYERFTSLIVVSPNNSSAGLYLLNAGNNTNPAPTLKKIVGNKLAGQIFYKMEGTTMSLFYKAPAVDAGPKDIFITFSEVELRYSRYDGSTDDMIEILSTE